MPIYRCRTSGSALAFSKEKGTPSIALAFASMFDTSNPEGQLSENDPVKLYTNLWLTEKTADRTVETLRQTFGWQGEDFAELNDGNPLDGIEVDIVWEWESYVDGGGQEKWRARVDWINKPGSGGVKRLDAAEAARIASQFNRLLKPQRAAGAAVPRGGVQGAQRPPQAGALNQPAAGGRPGAAPAAGGRPGPSSAGRPQAQAQHEAPPEMGFGQPSYVDEMPY